MVPINHFVTNKSTSVEISNAQVVINHALPCPILTITVASTTDASSIDIPNDFSNLVTSPHTGRRKMAFPLTPLRESSCGP